LAEIVLVAVLYVLLEPADKTLALVATFARLAMTTIQGVHLLNHLAALRLLSGAGYLRAFEPDQLRALALLFLDGHDDGILVWGLFFGLHLFFLGYLVYKSGYIPRILGVLLVFASLCYLAQTVGTILLPKYKEVLSQVGYLSFVELAFPLWLLIKGVRDQQRATTEAN
jgi:hypothetical protein